MPIPFSFLPEHIRTSIVKKQDVNAFVKFHQSSRECYKLAQKVKTRFTVSVKDLYLKRTSDGSVFFEYCLGPRKASRYTRVSTELFAETFPLRFEAKKINVFKPRDEHCKWLINFVLNTNSYFPSLILTGIKCSPKLFNQMLTVLRIKQLGSNLSLPSVYLGVPAMKKIDRLSVSSILHDDDFLSLKMATMYLYDTSVTSTGIYDFVKEWVDEDREIIEVQISSTEALHNILSYRGIVLSKGVEYNVARENGQLITFKLVNEYEIVMRKAY